MHYYMSQSVVVITFSQRIKSWFKLFFICASYKHNTKGLFKRIEEFFTRHYHLTRLILKLKIFNAVHVCECLNRYFVTFYLKD